MAAPEAEEQIKQIFDSFDADKSGTIELSQLKGVAEALGDKIEEEELAIIMQKLDVNGDGKISFEEFKFWWLQGRKGKLGELVYLKAKSMKMTKMFLDQFEKAGVSLKEFSKQNKVDVINCVLELGEPDPDGIELGANIYFKGSRFDEQFQKLKEKISWLKQSSVNFILMLPSDDPQKAKEELSALIQLVTNINLLPFLEDQSESNPFISIKLEPIEKCLVFHVQIKQGLTQVVKDPLNKFDEIKSFFDEDFYFMFQFLLKSNFSINDLLQTGSLIESLLKGFSLQFSGEAPSSVLKKFREVFEANSNEDMPLHFLLSVLLKNAYLRLKFKSPLMVQKFFQKIGIKEILTECPSLSDLLQQFSLSPDLQALKYNTQTPLHLIYKSLKCLKSNINSGIQFYINRQDTLIQIKTAFSNASKIFNILFNEV